MKIEIKGHELEDALMDILRCSLGMLQQKMEIGYIVVHNDDGTCFKSGIDDDGTLWLCKYTEDDLEVK